MLFGIKTTTKIGLKMKKNVVPNDSAGCGIPHKHIDKTASTRESCEGERRPVLSIADTHLVERDADRCQGNADYQSSYHLLILQCTKT